MPDGEWVRCNIYFKKVGDVYYGKVNGSDEYYLKDADPIIKVSMGYNNTNMLQTTATYNTWVDVSSMSGAGGLWCTLNTDYCYLECRASVSSNDGYLGSGVDMTSQNNSAWTTYNNKQGYSLTSNVSNIFETVASMNADGILCFSLYTYIAPRTVVYPSIGD